MFSLPSASKTTSLLCVAWICGLVAERLLHGPRAAIAGHCPSVFFSGRDVGPRHNELVNYW